jgi:hypothetical protein
MTNVNPKASMKQYTAYAEHIRKTGDAITIEQYLDLVRPRPEPFRIRRISKKLKLETIIPVQAMSLRQAEQIADERFEQWEQMMLVKFNREKLIAKAERMKQTAINQMQREADQREERLMKAYELIAKLSA